MLSAAIVMMLQAGGASVYAPKPEDPDSWILEYPRIISDEIDAYYGCLKSRGVANSAEAFAVFEEQHRAHIPLCAKQLDKALASANSILIGRKHYEDYTAEKIAATFKTIELIHIERGRKIDANLRRYIPQHATYDAAYKTTPEEVSGGERIAADLPPTTQEPSNAQD